MKRPASSETARPLTMYERFTLSSIFVITLFLVARIYAFASTASGQQQLHGDVLEYMTIAGHFSVWQDAFTYIGNRTYGYPLFIFAIRALTRPPNFEDWAAAINHFQFFFHIFACLVFYAVFIRKLFHGAGLSRTTTAIAAAALTTYPALIAYAMIPMTDTFCTDLLMIAASAHVLGRQAARPADFILLFFSGALLAYSVLVRPSFGVPLILFYAASFFELGASHEWRSRKTMGVALMMAASAMLVLPTMAHVWKAEHSIGLQDESFIPKYIPKSLQSGLSVVRADLALKWNNTSHEYVPGVKDPYLDKTYGQKCTVNSAGSLAACLLSQPQAIPVYFVKKTIALFDQPYGPSLAIFLQLRLLETAAFCGFVSLIIMTASQLFPALPKPVWIGFPWVAFILSLLSIHCVLHIEGRYGFPFIPFCLPTLFLGHAFVRKAGKKFYRWWLLAMIVSGACFLYQIFSWDLVPEV